MKSDRQAALDARNTAFESPHTEMAELRPGFEDADEQDRETEASEGSHRFPPKGRQVPRESLAERLRGPRKGA